MYSSIRYIKHDEIDFKKWDSVISNAGYSRVFAISDYLNDMCVKKWDALMLGDYEYVMPLPFRKAVTNFSSIRLEEKIPSCCIKAGTYK